MKFFRTDKSLRRQITNLQAEVVALTADRNQALRNEADALKAADDYREEVLRQREKMQVTLENVVLHYSNGATDYVQIRTGTVRG